MAITYTLNGVTYSQSGTSSNPQGSAPAGATNISYGAPATYGGGGTTTVPVPKYGDIVPGGQAVYDPNTGKPLAGAGLYNPNTGKLISSENLTPPNPVQLPTPPAPINPGNIVAANNTGLSSLLQGKYTTDANGYLTAVPQKDETPTEVATRQGMMENLRSLIGFTPKRESVYNTAEYKTAQSQVEARQQEVNNAVAQLNTIQAQRDQQILSLEGQGRGQTTGFIGGEQARINREAAIAALPIQASIAAAQGNLKLAQDHLDTITKIKTDELNSNYEYQTAVYNSVSGFLDKTEKIQLAKLQSELDTNTARQKSFIQTQQDLAQNALLNGASSSIISSIYSAKDEAGAFAAAGGYGADPVKAASIRASNALANQRSGNVSGVVSPNYKGEFGATINLVANTGTTDQQRNQISGLLKNFIGNGDYGSAYAVMTQQAGTALKGTAGTKFQEQVNAQGVLNDLKNAIQAYSDAGGNMNIFKGQADKIQTRIGQLYTDPKYAALATQLDSAFQNYRLQMTGAAFGAKESADYASVLPAKGNSLDLNLAKLNGANAYLNSSINSTLKGQFGEGAVYIKERAFLPNDRQPTQVNPNDPLGIL